MHPRNMKRETNTTKQNPNKKKKVLSLESYKSHILKQEPYTINVHIKSGAAHNLNVLLHTSQSHVDST